MTSTIFKPLLRQGLEQKKRKMKDHDSLNGQTVPITQSLIAADILRDLTGLTDRSVIGLLEVRPANEFIKLANAQPDPIYLYPYLIIEGEFVIFFGDPGSGKTVFSYGAGLEMARSGHKVLYVDLELSPKQFQKRFTNDNGECLVFPENFYRAEFARLDGLPERVEYDDYFFDSLRWALNRTNAKIVFLDNLTKLVAGDTDTAKHTIPVIEKLDRLRRAENLTLIVIEHNKKVDPHRPITLNDLQGSKMKSNLVDGVFTIGKSHKGKTCRYIKQLKHRSDDIKYDDENVKLFELSRKTGFLTLIPTGYGAEAEHLIEIEEREDIAVAVQMHEEGKSNVEIAKMLGVSEGAVRKWLKKRR
jgi:KaiC/GvpD/RAD55 family RecA-like ATPase